MDGGSGEVRVWRRFVGSMFRQHVHHHRREIQVHLRSPRRAKPAWPTVPQNNKHGGAGPTSRRLIPPLLLRSQVSKGVFTVFVHIDDGDTCRVRPHR